MADDVGVVLVPAVLVFPDDGGHLQTAHLLHQKHVQKPVGGVGLRHGVEAAAVEPPVADADHGLLGVNGFAADLNHIVFRNAPHHVHHRGRGIGAEALQQGKPLVPGDVGADAGIQTHGADVQGVVVVAADHVEGDFFGVQQPFQIGESGRFAEEPDKVVSAAAGIGGDGQIGKSRSPRRDFVQGAVAAAGVDAVFFPGLSRFPGDAAAFSRSLGYLNAVVKPPGIAAFHNGGGVLLRVIPAARSRVDDEQVFHFLSSLFWFFRELSVYI